MKEPVIEQARVHVAHVASLQQSELAESDELLEAQRSKRLHARMLSTFSAAAENQLILGQARYVLESDAAAARAEFSRLREWWRFFDAACEPALPTDEPFSAVHWISSLVGVLMMPPGELPVSLSADKVAETLQPDGGDERVVAWNDFAVTLVDLNAGGSRRAREQGPEFAAGQREAFITGYDTVLRAIAARDAATMRKSLAALAAGFRARKRQSLGVLHPFGYGKLSQAAGFDVLGVALCRLARRLGMPAEGGDATLHPAELMVD